MFGARRFRNSALVVASCVALVALSARAASRGPAGGAVKARAQKSAPAKVAKATKAVPVVAPLAAPVTAAAALTTTPIDQDDVQVFDDTVSFEQLLAKRSTLVREPASISPVARVIGVRRELGVNDREAALAAQDLVLNGGTSAGISEGMVLSVVRKIPVVDPYHDNRQTELEVEFAKIKIIHAQGDIAIARVEEIEKISEGLAVGTRAVLVGDFVTRGTK